jgi:DNA-binding PadR family transcriptional regulator
MQRSPSTQWSGSAGAIYPLMERLHKRGMLASKSARNGKRARKEYRVTPKGVQVLKSWIGPPLGDDAVTVTYDPLRSRARFLGVLTPAQRRAWVEAAAEALEEVSRRVERWREMYAAGDDPFAAVVSKHGEMDVEWRRRWLDEVGRAMGSPES